MREGHDLDRGALRTVHCKNTAFRFSPFIASPSSCARLPKNSILETLTESEVEF